MDKDIKEFRKRFSGKNGLLFEMGLLNEKDIETFILKVKKEQKEDILKDTIKIFKILRKEVKMALEPISFIEINFQLKALKKELKKLT